MALQEHEERYFHIPKTLFKLLLLWIWFFPLLIYNVTLIVKAYPVPVSPHIAIPSVLFWVSIFILLYVITFKTLPDY